MTTAPELPATTLASDCYSQMFSGCSSLNSIKIAYTGNFDYSYFSYWMSGVASTGTLYYDGEDTTTGASAIPTGWTVVPIVPPIEYVDYINTNRADFDTGVDIALNTSVEGKFRGESVGCYFVGGRSPSDGVRWEFFNAGGDFYICMPAGHWAGNRMSTSGWDTSKWYDISAGNYYATAVPETGNTLTLSDTAKTSFDSSIDNVTLKMGSSTYNWGG